MKFSLSSTSCLLATFLLFSVNSAHGQDDKRREFIEGLFRSIMESRTQNQAPPGLSVPVPPIPPAAQVPPPSNQSNQQLARYRELIGNYSGQANALANNLGQASSQKPNLRAYLSDVYTIRSQALQMQQSCNSVTHLHTVEPQFRTLDTAWRDLSFRLSNERSLNVACTQNVQLIEQYGNELSDLFGIQADFDRTRTVFVAGQATAYTSALVDLLQEQLQSQPATAGILQEGRQLIGLANHFGMNVANQTLPVAMESLQQWGNAWKVYEAKLRTIQNPSLAHAMSRVATCHTELYDLMRIERPMDYSYLQQLSVQMQLSIQALFNQLSLQSLGGLSPNQIQALIAAQQSVSNQMQVFQTSLQRNTGQQQVVNNFVNLYNSWQNVDRYLGALHGQAANSRATVQAQMGQIRDFLQVPDTLDMNRTLTQAAALEGLASNLYTVLAQTAQFIPQRSYRNQLFLQSQRFLQNAKIFHAQVASGSNQAALEQSCGTLVDSWQSCSQLIQGLPARGVQAQVHQSIDRVRCQIDVAVAEIAVVLSP